MHAPSVGLSVSEDRRHVLISGGDFTIAEARQYGQALLEAADLLKADRN